jgi:hypothetical protein
MQRRQQNQPRRNFELRFHYSRFTHTL